MEIISDYIDLVLHNPFMWGIWAQRLVYAVGFFLAIWTFKKTKTKGYLLIAAFFTFPYISLAAREISHLIHKEEIEVIAEKKNKELQEKIDRGEPVFIDQTIDLPIFEVLLVVGLYHVSRKQIKLCEPVVAHNSGGCAPSA